MAVQKLHISLRARGLPNVEGVVTGISDPFAVVSLSTPGCDDAPIKVGRTEV